MSAVAFDLAATRPLPTVPVCAGRILALAGVTFGAANLIQWGVMSGALGWHPAALGLSWPVAVGVFLTGLFRLRRAGGEAGRRVAGWSRLAILIHIGAALALAGLSVATGDWEMMRWTSAVGLGLYGFAWTLAAARAGNLNMAALAAAAFAGVAGIALRFGTPDPYLIYACALALVALIPGLWLALGRRL
ncbi:hypothetical protein [Brevundimonas sp.]|uniref:hypothetical protein n=1 Tax=Brevundimonas sp. TaxID=1871086 RepID=UPI002FC5C48C